MDAPLSTEEDIAVFLSGQKDIRQKVKKVEFPQLVKIQHQAPPSGSLSRLNRLHLDIAAELGRTTLTMRGLLGLKEGDVLELDKPAGEMTDIFVNEQRFAQGEVLVINEVFGIRMNFINTAKGLGLKEEG